MIDINDYNYPLPDERIAKFPLERRDSSKLLVYRDGVVSHRLFCNLGEVLPAGSMLVFNNTKVIRARIVMHKPSGARIEVFCLEPHNPADYERAFAVKGSSEWCCIVGNLKKWKQGSLQILFDYDGKPCVLTAERGEQIGKSHVVRFDWDADLTFGQLLEHLGRIPIPPYLNRESETIDNTRYQTVYAKLEGSVAAPTAGLHFTPELIESLRNNGTEFEEITLHVGAGTFLPVKEVDAEQHAMHTEHFVFTVDSLRHIIAKSGSVVAVGTTSVRTLESLAVLGCRVVRSGEPDCDRPIGQWEAAEIGADMDSRRLLGALVDYMECNNIDRMSAATQIMITPSFRYRVVNVLITNFHQPKSTLLLLVSAFVGDDWHKIYDYALSNDFRFLSYGDSSILFPHR